MQSKQLEQIKAPFIHLAHHLRNGDTAFIESTLHMCGAFIIKYNTVFKDKKTLTLLLRNVNSAYKRKDFVNLADIFEYEMTEYLENELASSLNLVENTIH